MLLDGIKAAFRVKPMIRDDIDLGWLAGSMLAPVTEKNWVTIHGHPVNIGGGSGGGSGGHASASGGAGGGAKDGPMSGGEKPKIEPPDASAVADVADMIGKMKGRGGIRSKLDFDKGKFHITVAKSPFDDSEPSLPEGWHGHLNRAGLPPSNAKVTKIAKGGVKYEWDV